MYLKARKNTHKDNLPLVYLKIATKSKMKMRWFLC